MKKQKTLEVGCFKAERRGRLWLVTDSVEGRQELIPAQGFETQDYLNWLSNEYGRLALEEIEARGYSVCQTGSA